MSTEYYPAEVKVRDAIQRTVDAFKFDADTADLEDFNAILEKVPSSKEAAMLCIYMLASHQVKNAWCDHHSPDPDWVRVLAIMWKHFPEYSTNQETGERFL